MNSTEANRLRDRGVVIRPATREPASWMRCPTFQAIHIATLAIGAAILASGCALTKYQPAEVGVGGYFEQFDRKSGVWTVTCMSGGGGWELCDPIARYRCAELAYEKGYRFYRVIEGGDQSGRAMAGRTNGVQSSGMEGYAEYKIRLSKDDPGGAGAVDAYHVLDHTKVPGFKDRHTVAERNKEKKRGSKNT